MNLFSRILSNRKMDQAPAEGSPGGNGSSPESKAPPESGAAPGAPAPKEEGNHLDFYSQPAPDDKKPSGEPPKKDDSQAPAEPEKATESATGYGSEPEELKPDGEKPPEKKEDPAAPPEPPKDELGFELKLEDFSEDEAKSIKAKVKEYGLSKESAEKFAADRKAELQAITKKAEDTRKEWQRQDVERKKSWHKELKEDKTFGGENFDRNVTKVDKLISEFMPETKKGLTQSKAMLRPTVMRELLKVADAVYGTKSFMPGEGEKVPEKKDETKAESPLDFYNS